MKELTLFAKIEEELYSAVLSDTLDRVGVRNHTANPRIRPLRPNMVVSGRAATMLCQAVDKMPERPYEMVIRALDALKPGEVPFLSVEGEGAIWGELLSTASRARGARGTVIDGDTRDVKKIVRMKYPVFSKGVTPTDSAGRIDITEIGTPVRSGDTVVRNGDLVFADLDGVIIIPQDVEQDVIRLSFEKARKESAVRRDLLRGIPLREVWEKHRVL